MFPILFQLRRIAVSSQATSPGYGSPLGVPPFMGFLPPFPPMDYRLVGVTRDSFGVALAGCTLSLFRTIDNVLVNQAVSDGGGNYLFTNCSPGLAYYIVAYLAGSPDVAGTTVNTLFAAA
jgi:hypothetical protein